MAGKRKGTYKITNRRKNNDSLVRRGDWRLTFPNDVMGTRLLHLAIAQTKEFKAFTFYALGSTNA